MKFKDEDMNKIIDFYENINVYDGELSCDNKRQFDYKVPSSIHSEITEWAYGKIITRSCFDISDRTELIAKFDIADNEKRFKLKIVGCLKEWKKCVIDIEIKVNGALAYKNIEELFENVNLGWPSIYFDINSHLFNKGENRIEISTKNANGAGFLVHSVKLLSLPKISEYEQISATEFVKENQVFSIAVENANKDFIGIESIENCKFIKSTYFDDTCVLTFKSKGAGKVSAIANFMGAKVKLKAPLTVENNDQFLIGIDSDDHRHDLSEEFNRINKMTIFSDMGNFIQYRPQRVRNYYKLAPKQEFEKQVELMELFGVKYGLCDGEKLLSFLPEKYQDNFYGYHIHETYQFFSTVNESLDSDIELDKSYFKFKELKTSSCFADSKKLFMTYLEKIKSDKSEKIGLTSVGSPSLLCVYEGDAGFDRITLEPVSNVNLLLGAVRATSVKVWGAHVPTDWYFGVPIDQVKSNKYRLMMQYIYLNGASYVYAENSLFKTNAFDRLDFEDEHLKINRQILRDFYHYTQTHPRKGELKVDKALLYGKNEFIMWQTNDRMGELKEDDWDGAVWGKWDNDYHDCWQASKGWMPISDKQMSVESPLNTKLFAGSPYGSVDVVYAEKDLEKYKTIALLGWNTMDDKVLSNLKKFVKGGGTLVISYCHFNTVDRCDKPFEFMENSKITDFLGVEVDGEFVPDTRVYFEDQSTYLVENKVNCALCNSVGAKVVCKDRQGNGIVYKNYYGKGKVYLCAFKEYYNKPWAIDLVAHLLEYVGKQGDFICNNKNVSFTVRQLSEKQYVVNVLNMNCLLNATENFTLSVFGKTISDSIKVGEIKEYTIKI